MFQAIKITAAAEQYMPDGKIYYPYGNAPMIKSCVGLPYGYRWKKMTRDEGVELMKKYPPYRRFFTSPRFFVERRSEARHGEPTMPYFYLMENIVIPTGPYPPTPICLWMPTENEAWIKERVDIIIDLLEETRRECLSPNALVALQMYSAKPPRIATVGFSPSASYDRQTLYMTRFSSKPNMVVAMRGYQKSISDRLGNRSIYS